MPEREIDVDVIFSCDEFELRIHWESDASTTDEARAEGAAVWFSEKYGFNPGQYAKNINVERREDPR